MQNNRVFIKAKYAIYNLFFSMKFLSTRQLTSILVALNLTFYIALIVFYAKDELIDLRDLQNRLNANANFEKFSEFNSSSLELLQVNMQNLMQSQAFLQLENINVIDFLNKINKLAKISNLNSFKIMPIYADKKIQKIHINGLAKWQNLANFLQKLSKEILAFNIVSFELSTAQDSLLAFNLNINMDYSEQVTEAIFYEPENLDRDSNNIKQLLQLINTTALHYPDFKFTNSPLIKNFSKPKPQATKPKFITANNDNDIKKTILNLQLRGIFTYDQTDKVSIVLNDKIFTGLKTKDFIGNTPIQIIKISTETASVTLKNHETNAVFSLNIKEKLKNSVIPTN